MKSFFSCLKISFMFVDKFENFTPEEWAKLINSNPNLYLVIFLHFGNDGKAYNMSGLKRTALSWAPFFSEIAANQDADYYTPLDISVLYDYPIVPDDIISKVKELNALAQSPYGQALIEAGGRKGLLLKAFEKGVSRLALFIIVTSRLIWEKKYFSLEKVKLLNGAELLDYLASRVYVYPSLDEKESYNFTKQIHDALLDLIGIVPDNPLKEWMEEFKLKLAKILIDNDITRPEEVVEFFMYNNLKFRYPDFCPLFARGEICHKNMKKENFNCFFCACPYFYTAYYNVRERQFGKCRLGSRKGRYDESGQWNCSECSFVHYPKYVLRYLTDIPSIIGSIRSKISEDNKS